MSMNKINWHAVSSLIGAGVFVLVGWTNVTLNDILKIVSAMDTQIQLNAKDNDYLRKDLNGHIRNDELHKQFLMDFKMKK